MDNGSAAIVSVPATLAGDWAIHMQSGAMAPGLLKGDLLVVRETSTADAGKVVVAKVNGEATVRRYYPDDPEKGKTRLAADNPTIEAIVAASADMVVMGVVVGLVRAL